VQATKSSYNSARVKPQSNRVYGPCHLHPKKRNTQVKLQIKNSQTVKIPCEKDNSEIKGGGPEVAACRGVIMA